MRDKKPTIQSEMVRRILILDGAMGSMIQRYHLTEEDYRGEEFALHAVPLKGNNDILSLTRPDIIRSIHTAYVEAGADIIETNTFSSQAVSQHEYGCSALIYRMNYESASIARAVADAADHHVWVIGSMGPTARTLSLASDAERPAFRLVDFDTMAEAYAEQVRALIDGGVEGFLVETVYDALNAKAALYAIQKVQSEKRTTLPVMLSVTVNDRSGRLLTGITIEGALAAVKHYPLMSFGVNCSFGAEDLARFAETLSPELPCALSFYPNAGLPNAMGQYDESPEEAAHIYRALAEKGCLNIAGGCCGTTPAHIKAVAEALKEVPPRVFADPESSVPVVSGLETVPIERSRNLTYVGERTNVAGSRKFAKLIIDGNYDDAVTVARHQIEGGASIIDINMDDAMIDAPQAMTRFIRTLNNDPEVARAALMIDSSSWETILAGLKNAQGRSIVNSISLKEGEASFLEKAREIHRLGAMVVVMAFDEAGQAVSYERKIAICERSFRLLTEQAQFRPEEIIFDPNILTVGTGMEEHNRCAVDFIEAVRWIKTNLPGCLTSGGVSNLSFAFRGNQAVREAMHTVFLYYAVGAGLDMAILNPTMIQCYDALDPRLRKGVEDVILNRDKEATARLVAMAPEFAVSKDPAAKKEIVKEALTPREGLVEALVRGNTDRLHSDLQAELDAGTTPVELIETVLMSGMEQVGTLFGMGKLFLPQVVRSAWVMKEAVAYLRPAIEKSQATTPIRRPKMVLATVKGDVHDIGKNIVSIVLRCHNVEVVDLGVMVDNYAILEAARREKADLIGVSGLITPSLSEMENLCRMMQEEGFRIPLLVGGATTSALHTAVKLAPLYDGGVLYGGDASRAATMVSRLTAENSDALNDYRHDQDTLRALYKQSAPAALSYEEACRRAPCFSNSVPSWDIIPETLYRFSFEELIPEIDWRFFFTFWNFKTPYPELLKENSEAVKLYDRACAMLQKMRETESVSVRAVIAFYGAEREGDEICLYDKAGHALARLPMWRQQSDISRTLSLADYLPPSGSERSVIGAMGLTVTDAEAQQYDPLSEEALLRQSLCERLVEAASELLTKRYPVQEGMKVIRPAIGYTCIPDHSLKRDLFDLLHLEDRLGMTLSSHYAMSPLSSLCALLIAHPEAAYFTLGPTGEDQLALYCRKRHISVEEGRKIIGL